MKFGVFYELQIPRPWGPEDELKLVQESLEQVELADQLGIDHAWAVEHHFLEEYSHCAAPEVFLAAAAGRTKRIRLGQGIRQVIPKYNHPARTAEVIGTLDLVSNGRAEFGIGESATRLELGGFGIPAKQKRAMSLDAAEQIANMMVMEPYPGYEGEFFSMPARNVVPKPIQKPHPPMWIACTNRETIKVAARNGLGALAFSFLDPQEAKMWSDIYYGLIKSEECVPIGHSVNPNIAMVSSFSIHHDRDEAIRRGQEGFEFFGYAINALVAHDTIPGRSRLWDEFQELKTKGVKEEGRNLTRAPGIGTPDDLRQHIGEFQEVGVDQVIFLQQAGRNKHEDICSSLELFAKEVMPGFVAEREQRDRKKQAELAPFIEAAMKRKKVMPALRDEEIPVVKASVAHAQVS